MIILGVGGFQHDFNAAAINTETGETSAFEEERFSRIKHHPILGKESSSIDSLNYVLKQVGGTANSVKFIVFSDVQVHPLNRYLMQVFPAATAFHVEHHVCHAAAAYYCSGFDDAAILSLDGFGDLKGGMLAHGVGSSLRALSSIEMENSIGLEYLRVTYQLGLGSYGAEGKTQGLAPFGRPLFEEDYFREIELKPDGRIALSDSLKRMKEYIDGEHYIEERSLFNDFIAERVTRRFKHEDIEPQHMDMASSIQEVLNKVALHSAQYLKKTTASKNLVLAGGVSQNSSMNGYLLKSKVFENVYSHPSSSDRGNALGAALYFANEYLGQKIRRNGPLVYAGPEYSDDQIQSEIEARKLPYAVLIEPAIEAAKLIADGAILGWFQGRSELGARALGNRSILADPRKKENIDIINAKVKHREWFRPFAPSVLVEYAEAWFETDRPLPHMQFTVPVLEAKRSVVPAITHVDGSARVQTVSKEFNPLYHELIAEFHKFTGVPMLLNTSFNDAGDPIVESPGDAIDCLLKTDLDCVVLGKYLVRNPKFL
jgi:carbamoyltransferase